jgi:hypothetical protein
MSKRTRGPVAHSSTRKARGWRAPVVVTLIGAAAALAGCDGAIEGEPFVTENPPPPPADGGPDANPDARNDVDPPVCPVRPPTPNSACSGALSCSWGAMCGGGTFATCENGRWLVGVGNPPPPLCPATMPQQGTACDATCGPKRCDYSVPCGNFPNTHIAMCENGRWNLLISTCNPPPPWWDGGPPTPIDAGTTPPWTDASDGEN